MLPVRIQEQAAKQSATGEIIAVHDGGKVFDRKASVAEIKDSTLLEASLNYTAKNKCC